VGADLGQALSILFTAAGVTSSSVRHTVGADAAAEDLALVTHDVDVGDRLPAARDQDRNVDQDPALIMRGG
jgi:hypothetical protein